MLVEAQYQTWGWQSRGEFWRGGGWSPGEVGAVISNMVSVVGTSTDKGEGSVSEIGDDELEVGREGFWVMALISW